MPLLETIGGQAFGTGMGLLLQKHNNKVQLEQQGKLNEMAMRDNKSMAIFNKEQQLDLWNKTSYPAQLEQMKKAGINPALMYGGAGSGGTTQAAQAQGVSTGQAEGSHNNEVQQGQAMGMQLAAQVALMAAQKENIEADTANKLAQQHKTATVDTENTAQDTLNKKAQEGLTKVQTEIAKIQQTVAGDTMESTIANINTQTQIAYKELKMAGQSSDIQGATMENQIEQIQANAIGALLNNTLTQAKISNTNTDTWAIGRRIAQEWSKIDQKDVELGINKFRAEIQANYPGITQVMGKSVNSFIESLFKMTTGEHSWTPEHVNK